MTGRVALAALVALALLPVAAGAHTRSVSYSSWTLDDDGAGASVRVRVPLLELSRLALDPVLDVGSGGRAVSYLAEHLRLVVGDDACTVSAPLVAEPSPEGWAHFRWRVACASSGAPAIETDVLLDVAPSHMHFARVATDGGALERVLTEGQRRWPLPDASGAGPADASGTTLAGYVALGVEHIVSGWDHLAFVLALLLLAATFSEVAGLVTAFTVAHSLTLALAVLGVLQPDGAAIEALIGFSIALVAAENAWLLSGRGPWVPFVAVAALVALAGAAWAGAGVVSGATLLGLALFTLCHFGMLDRVERPARLRAAVAFAFGLVHGFGFAGVLAEMQLPTARLAPALFGFNVGVELGQLAIVAAVWPALRWLARRSPHRWHRGVAEVGSAAICGMGLYWFLTRTLG